MTQGYGPQDPNEPPPGQPPSYPPPPPAYGPPAPGAYGQQQPGYGAEQPGFYMGHQLANWPQRVGAYLIDGLIISIPIAIAAALLSAGGNSNGSSGAVLISVLLYLAAFGVHIYNRWIMQGRTGQSWGKQALGIKLLRMTDGQPVGGGMAFLRDIAHVLDSIVCYIGFLWPLWDAKRQTFADKVLNTVVIAD
jgi:uncharacterized RDD family membrane protein YckC